MANWERVNAWTMVLDGVTITVKKQSDGKVGWCCNRYPDISARGDANSVISAKRKAESAAIAALDEVAKRRVSA